MNDVKKAVMTNWRWVMCAMLFFATTVNYMDRQVLRTLFSASSPVSSSTGWARRKVTSGRL